MYLAGLTSVSLLTPSVFIVIISQSMSYLRRYLYGVPVGHCDSRGEAVLRPHIHRSFVMPDPTSMTEARARLVKTSPTPLELVGRSTAIARVHELVRRAALTDGGVLLVADRGADVTSVAEELHARTRRAAAPFVQVDCASSDPTRLDEWLFGAAPIGVRRSRGGFARQPDRRELRRNDLPAGRRGAPGVSADSPRAHCA